MRNLLWFHALRRNSTEDLLAALQAGPIPALGLKSKTAANETALGLPPAVYAYLGRSSSLFGPNGFALELSTPAGSISPFDTGGLVEHIVPVRDWTAEDRQAFLKDYSWAHTQLLVQLALHPTDGAVRAYLDGVAPAGIPGPHALWPGRSAPIWDSTVNDWPAWTWEIRCAKLPAGRNIHGWTCPPHIFAEIQTIAAARPADVAWFKFLFERYVPGGITQMLARFRRHQETP